MYEYVTSCRTVRGNSSILDTRVGIMLLKVHIGGVLDFAN